MNPFHTCNLFFLLQVSFQQLQHVSAFRPQTCLFSTTPKQQQQPQPQPLPETQPLAPHTFAGMIEAGIIDRFGADKAHRVIQSLRLKDCEYEHREYAPGRNPDTSQCLQICNSYVPNLTIREFWNIDNIAWAQKLKSKYYKAIRQEFQTVTADMERLVREGNNVWAGALTEDAASYGEGWTTLVLKDRSYWDQTNAKLFPVTSKAIRDCGVPAVEVFFASLKPGSDIKPHSDFTNFVLTSHLALQVPYSGQNKCRLTIGDETRQWIDGEIMLFDTSVLHHAVNESDETRYILMLRVWHPDLTEVEREALQFIYDSLTIPELVTGDEEERARAALEIQRMKSFPKLDSINQGFGGTGLGRSSKRKKGNKKK